MRTLLDLNWAGCRGSAAGITLKSAVCSLSASFKTANKSAEDFSRALSNLQEIARTTPHSFTDLAEEMAVLLRSGEIGPRYGLSAREAAAIMDTLSKPSERKLVRMIRFRSG